MLVFFFLLNENFIFYFFPVILLLVLVMLFSLDKLFYLIAFLTPFSISLTDIGLGVGVNFPTEPLLFSVMIICFMKLVMVTTSNLLAHLK